MLLTLTKKGGGPLHFILVDIGEQRLRGLIPHHRAALAHKPGSVLNGWDRICRILVKTHIKRAEECLWPEQRCCNQSQASFDSHPSSTARWICWITPDSQKIRPWQESKWVWSRIGPNIQECDRTLPGCMQKESNKEDSTEIPVEHHTFRW